MSRIGKVSAAFTVPTGEFGEQVQKVFDLVDGIHQVDQLPVIPVVEQRRLYGISGRYRFHRHQGTAIAIEIAVGVRDPRIVLLHEIGHFIDHQALGWSGRFASRRHPDCQNWRRAVESSDAVNRLHALRREQELRGEQTGAAVYMLDYTEIWARSYAQYVIAKSDDAELPRVLSTEAAPFGHLARWSAADFEPIRAAIDDLFRRKGWIA